MTYLIFEIIRKLKIAAKLRALRQADPMTQYMFIFMVVISAFMLLLPFMAAFSR